MRGPHTRRSDKTLGRAGQPGWVGTGRGGSASRTPLLPLGGKAGYHAQHRNMMLCVSNCTAIMSGCIAGPASHALARGVSYG